MIPQLNETIMFSPRPLRVLLVADSVAGRSITHKSPAEGPSIVVRDRFPMADSMWAVGTVRMIDTPGLFCLWCRVQEHEPRPFFFFFPQGFPVCPS